MLRRAELPDCQPANQLRVSLQVLGAGAGKRQLLLQRLMAPQDEEKDLSELMQQRQRGCLPCMHALPDGRPVRLSKAMQRLSSSPTQTPRWPPVVAVHSACPTTGPRCQLLSVEPRLGLPSLRSSLASVDQALERGTQYH